MPDNLEPLTMDQLEVLEELSVPSRLAPSQVLSIRLTDTELRRLANEARLVGMKVGVFIKRSAIDAADTHRFSSGPAVQFGIAGDGLA